MTSSASDPNSIVCTLCEGSYWHGAVVLLNSLVCHGFRGEFVVGYRGEVPPWFDAVSREAPGRGVQLRLQTVAGSRHMTNLKPDFMLELARAVRPPAGAVFYFDPDIVNKAPWEFYERWVKSGVALCEDVNSPMDGRHPIRQEWCRYFGLPRADRTGSRCYFNGGFVGVSAADLEFLVTWKRFQDLAEDRGVDLGRVSARGREYAFHKNDQDFLNVAGMVHDARLSPVGKEGMDFVPGGQLMSHSIGRFKPWHAGYFRRVLRGFRPGLVDVEYWRRAESPFRSHSALRARLARLELLCAAALGRLIARS